jgi:hypothetical protein
VASVSTDLPQEPPPQSAPIEADEPDAGPEVRAVKRGNRVRTGRNMSMEMQEPLPEWVGFER